MSLERLGKYRIRRVLGKGAMGTVYLAFDPDIEREVAIKTIRKDTIDPDLAAQYLARAPAQGERRRNVCYVRERARQCGRHRFIGMRAQPIGDSDRYELFHFGTEILN